MFFGCCDYLPRISGVYRIVRTGCDYATPRRNVSVLSYRVSGQGQIRQGDTITVADGGNILFFPADTPYRQKTDGETVIAVHLDISALSERRIESVPVPRGTDAAMVFTAILTAWEEGALYRAAAILYDLLAKVCLPRTPGGLPILDAGLSPALRLIATACTDSSLSVPRLADACGVSVSQFRRNFRRAYNMSPAAYLCAFRIARAKNLLSGGMRVSEVADLCGFSDPKYFSTVFRRLTGLSPAAFMKQQRG